MQLSKWVSPFFLFAIICVISCAGPNSSNAESLNPSVYYIPAVSAKNPNCPAQSFREFMSPEGRVFTKICSTDFKLCLRQGTCFVDDGEKNLLYNYHSTKGNVARFVIVDISVCPYGYGVKDTCLDPFFTVAADLHFYRPGDVIFIPILVGKTLPNGQVHDGFFIIRDEGGGVDGASRFDFYTGSISYRSKENIFVQLGFADPHNKIEFRMATSEEAEAARKRRNYPFVVKSN